MPGENIVTILDRPRDMGGVSSGVEDGVVVEGVEVGGEKGGALRVTGADSFSSNVPVHHGDRSRKFTHSLLPHRVHQPSCSARLPRRLLIT
jgi:hypothetical protein